jgi:hypothetical protein
MKASRVVENLQYLIRQCGDREVKYLGVKDQVYLFEESVSTLNCCANDIYEPIIIFGDSYAELKGERLIQLNWLGRLLKKIITKQKE